MWVSVVRKALPLVQRRRLFLVCSRAEHQDSASFFVDDVPREMFVPAGCGLHRVFSRCRRHEIVDLMELTCTGNWRARCLRST